MQNSTAKKKKKSDLSSSEKLACPKCKALTSLVSSGTTCYFIKVVNYGGVL